MRAVALLLVVALLAACGADGPPARPVPEAAVVGLAEAEAFALDPAL